MGERGPAPKPQALKKKQGTYRPDRDGGATVAKSTKPRCPSFLGQAAKKEWHRIANPLYDAGLLRGVDRSLLAAYCDAYGTWVEMVIDLKREDPVNVTDKNFMQANPKIKIANQAKADMLRLAKEFGMTPSARGRIVADDSGKTNEQQLADILFAAVNE